MRLDYFAHSCFSVKSDGFCVLFDPYDPSIGYPSPKVFDVDLVVVSHDHFDHNAVEQVPGRVTVVRGIAKRPYGPLVVSGQIGWHGEGEDSDPVSLTLVEWADRRLAHFGDIGRGLDGDQMEFFSDLDLLLMPCGGDYTLGGTEASALVEKLRPKVVVPMHYRTPFLSRTHFPGLETEASFLEACSRFATVETVRQGFVNLEEVWEKRTEGKVSVLHLQHQLA